MGDRLIGLSDWYQTICATSTLGTGIVVMPAV